MKISKLPDGYNIRPNGGFTLIELLTVIGIIGILAAILIPVVGSVRLRAASAKSASNLRQIGMAMHLYLEESNDRLPHNTNWHISLLPFLGYELVNGEIPKPAEEILFHPRDISPPREEARRSYAMNHPNWGDSGFPPLNEVPFSLIEFPSGLMIFTERPNQTWPAHSQNGGGIATPQNQADWQWDLNGEGVYNYFFADGHVRNRRYDDPEMIGRRASPESPRGMWRPDWFRN